jgi:hypothetical protein
VIGYRFAFRAITAKTDNWLGAASAAREATVKP